MEHNETISLATVQMRSCVEEFLRAIDERRHAARVREDVADAEASGARDARSLIAELEASRRR